MKNLPMLKGYRVLDIGQFVAAPTCTRILAEMGAEVIKLELAPFGDRGRFAGDKPRDPALKKSSQSTYFFSAQPLEEVRCRRHQAGARARAHQRPRRQVRCPGRELRSGRDCTRWIGLRCAVAHQ